MRAGHVVKLPVARLDDDALEPHTATLAGAPCAPGGDVLKASARHAPQGAIGVWLASAIGHQCVHTVAGFKHDLAVAVAPAQAQADAVIAAAERSAGSVKGSIASAKVSAVADLQAIGSAVDAIPSSKTVTVTVTSNASGGTSTGAAGRADGAYAGGGSFVTSGTTNITVGDNPGGRELVTVTPLSGSGTTRPVPGGIAMAGGGSVVVDAGDGYTTPVAGGD